MDIEEQVFSIEPIANLLQEILEETDHLESPLLTQFHVQKRPTISLLQYLQRIQKYSQCSDAAYIGALIYLDRVQEFQTDLIINSTCIHRFLLIAIVLSIKYLDDDYYKNEYYAKIGGISTSELSQLELEMLMLLDYRMYIRSDIFHYYKDRLLKYSKI